MHTLLVDVQPLNLSFSVLQPPGEVPRSSTCRYISIILLFLRHHSSRFNCEMSLRTMAKVQYFS